jgi:hypothetical protein
LGVGLFPRVGRRGGHTLAIHREGRGNMTTTACGIQSQLYFSPLLRPTTSACDLIVSCIGLVRLMSEQQIQAATVLHRSETRA